jgi:hypothetical protein
VVSEPGYPDVNAAEGLAVLTSAICGRREHGDAVNGPYQAYH